MPQPTRNVEDTVNYLVAICRDGAQGYSAAADAIKPQGLKAELLELSRERAGFASTLSSAMAGYGFTPRQHGSASGALHRGLIHLMKITPGDNEHAVLSACEKGEDAALEAYAKAATVSLPGTLGDLISQQYQAIRNAHGRIRCLRDTAVEA